jgi:hypothetical protein
LPTPSDGRIAASRRTETQQPRLLTALQPLCASSLPSNDRVPPRDDSLHSLPGDSHKSPPLCRPAQRSGASALCRATRRCPSGRNKGPTSEGGDCEAGPSAGTPVPPHRGSPLPKQRPVIRDSPGADFPGGGDQNWARAPGHESTPRVAPLQGELVQPCPREVF